MRLRVYLRATKGTSWPGLAEAGLWHFSRLVLLPNHLSPDVGATPLPSTGPPWRSALGLGTSRRGRAVRHGPREAWSTHVRRLSSPSTTIQSHEQKHPKALWFSCGPAVRIGCPTREITLCLRCSVLWLKPARLEIWNLFFKNRGLSLVL